jgi:hypothetical protein
MAERNLQSDVVPLYVELDPALDRKLRAMAELHHRTLKGEVTFLIERAIASFESPPHNGADT